MRAFLMAFLFLLWLILGYQFYNDHQRCCESEIGHASPLSTPQHTAPILFAYNSSVPILGPSWPALRDSLVLLVSDSTSLEITAWYCANLTPPETEIIALARAGAIKKMFNGIPAEQCIIVTKRVVCDSARMAENEVAASLAIRMQTENIKEEDDKTLIYFPFNSTKKLDNESIELYLTKIAQNVIKSGKSIVLTGHTDAIGDESSNLLLGQQRADIIKSYLINLGVDKDKIQALSKGENMPLADNTSESGRAKNRRTELQIIH
jgi:outer membrane protein OmpA-like peptidoglycan-associated protein